MCRRPVCILIYHLHFWAWCQGLGHKHQGFHRKRFVSGFLGPPCFSLQLWGTTIQVHPMPWWLALGDEFASAPSLRWAHPMSDSCRLSRGNWGGRTHSCSQRAFFLFQCESCKGDVCLGKSGFSYCLGCSATASYVHMW